jgi:predicted Zn-dependent protease
LGIEQHVSLTPEQEIAMGLQSLPMMVQQYGGLDPDQRGQNLVKTVGKKLVQNSVAAKTPYQYDFHLLADQETVNAFALPGGHSGERMSKEGLLSGLANAVGIALGDYGAAQMAQQAAALIGLKYGRDQELQSDELGVKFMLDSKYNPEAMIDVMEILKQASGGSSQDEFTSTHPDPDNRKEKIRAAIDKYKK